MKYTDDFKGIASMYGVQEELVFSVAFAVIKLLNYEKENGNDINVEKLTFAEIHFGKKAKDMTEGERETCRKLQNKMCRRKRLNTKVPHEKCFARQMFGKKVKDLTPEERKEYNKKLREIREDKHKMR